MVVLTKLSYPPENPLLLHPLTRGCPTPTVDRTETLRGVCLNNVQSSTDHSRKLNCINQFHPNVVSDGFRSDGKDQQMRIGWNRWHKIIRTDKRTRYCAFGSRVICIRLLAVLYCIDTGMKV
ncbi:hypothetical protein CY34DRAFT_635488 [Suillus luteus UH-Slu-Lm8-n1]|uniref:Uncharacterized protein n=1 Tax=Suillus luteus UH-Slu-Lm8-n1 TaxID=930992 RepID=A0A0C9ZYP8_9AGAM|nr:hypothetical protein CY34DRAFT_635488 [Suillus luteus UH-Slu-Lm8-n1]